MADLAVARNDQQYERLRAHEAQLYDAVLAGSAEGVRDAMHAVARADAAINTPPGAAELVGAEVIVPVPDASLYKYNTLDAALDALLADAGFLALSVPLSVDDDDEGQDERESAPYDYGPLAGAGDMVDILLEENVKLSQALVTLDDELTEARSALGQARGVAMDDSAVLDKLTELSGYIDRLDIQFETMQDESERLLRTVRDELEVTENELKQRVVTLEAQNATLRRERSAAVNKYRLLQKGAAVLKIENSTTRTALTDLRAREKALEAEVARLNQQGSNVRLQQTRIGDLEQTNAQQLVLIGDLEQTNAQQLALIGDLEQTRAQQQTRIGNLQQVNAKLASELDTATQTERELRAIIRGDRLVDETQSNATILQLEATVRNQEKELERETKQVEALKNALEQQKMAEGVLKDRNRELNDRLSGAIAKYKQELAESEDAREELITRWSSALVEANDAYLIYKQQSREQREEIDALSDQVAALKRQLAEATGRRVSARLPESGQDCASPLQLPVSPAAPALTSPRAIAQELEPWPDMDLSDSDDSLSAEAADIDVGSLSRSLSSLSLSEGEVEGEVVGAEQATEWEAESEREMDWFDIM